MDRLVTCPDCEREFSCYHALEAVVCECGRRIDLRPASRPPASRAEEHARRAAEEISEAVIRAALGGVFKSEQLAPIIARHIAAARAEMKERCAVTAENDPTRSYGAYAASDQKASIAAAIRALD